MEASTLELRPFTEGEGGEGIVFTEFPRDIRIRNLAAIAANPMLAPGMSNGPCANFEVHRTKSGSPRVERFRLFLAGSLRDFSHPDSPDRTSDTPDMAYFFTTEPWGCGQKITIFYHAGRPWRRSAGWGDPWE